MYRRIAVAGAALVLAAGGWLADAEAREATALMEQARALFEVLPDQAPSPSNALTAARTDLGRKLYYEKRLSRSGEISCNSCHDLAAFGVDGEPTSPGHEGQRGGRNSPTVYNAAFHIAQFWDGRAKDVEEQAGGPILNPIEMAMPSKEAVVELLQSIPEYPPLFAKAFPEDEEPLTYGNLTLAIGAFERRLTTPSRFDAFMGGDVSALSAEELAGLDLFMAAGCTTCHLGPVVGGSLYRKLGLVKPYETDDPGRFDVTGNEQDRAVFKVPSLRNIEKTGPYLHDGSVSELKDMIRLMGIHQLGRELSDEEVASIESFLNSLTGTVDEAYIAER
jgi:cytochrome c peroxidase